MDTAGNLEDVGRLVGYSRLIAYLAGLEDDAYLGSWGSGCSVNLPQ